MINNNISMIILLNNNLLYKTNIQIDTITYKTKLTLVLWINILIMNITNIKNINK
jgi:hypothetical protein